MLCHNHDRWTKFLPIILLGLRTTYKEDIKASPAELVYGTTLRIPSEFFTSQPNQRTESEVLNDLREAMQDLQPRQTSWHTSQKVFQHPDLQTCTHVFLRNDAVRPSLSHPYEGPFEILNRSDKYFKIKVNNRESNVSVDRLKPAYLAIQPQQAQNGTQPPVLHQDTPSTTTTRSGRHIRFPTRFPLS